MALLLQGAESRSVGRAQIEDEKVAVRAKEREGSGIVLGGAIELRLPGFSHIDPDRKSRPPSFRTPESQPTGHRFGSFAGETEPIPEGFRSGETEEAGRRIRLLRGRGHRADLAESEPQRLPRAEGDSVLVEAGGEAERARETESPHRPFQAGRERREEPPEPALRPALCAEGEREMVRAFRREKEEQAAEDRAVEHKG